MTENGGTPQCPFERLDALIEEFWLRGQEMEFKVATQTECAWYGELRFVPEPGKAGEPALVYSSSGKAGPLAVAEELLAAFEPMASNQRRTQNGAG